MFNTVKLFISFNNEPEADVFIDLAHSISGGERYSIVVAKSFFKRAFSGNVIISFPRVEIADQYRRAVRSLNRGSLFSVDGEPVQRWQEPPVPVPMVTANKEANNAQENGSGTSGSDFWNLDRLKRCLPRVVTPPVTGFGQLIETQHQFNSRAVNSNEYPQLPFKAVGKLAFTGVNWQTCQGEIDYAGSAWLIAPRIIMTVAHNLFEVNCQERAPNVRSSNVVFFPGFSSDQQTQESYSVIDFNYVKAYEGNPSAVHDVGIGILDRDASSLGQIPPLTDGALNFNKVTAVGYPGNHDFGTEMWMCEGTVVPELSNSSQFIMASDFGSGSSGGPWVVNTANGWRAVGAQVGDPYGVGGNYSVSAVFGQQVVDLISWANSIVSST